MIITITGSDTDLGKKLYSKLFGRKYHLERISYGMTHEDEIYRILATTNFVFHLEEVKDPESEIDLYNINTKFTQDICDILTGLDNKATVIYLSVPDDQPETTYNLSKITCEIILKKYSKCIIIKPLPNTEYSDEYILNRLIEELRFVKEPVYTDL